jgi:glycosyltransferase involved in cell wall biosynthesis
MIKILFLTTGLTTGGAEVMLYRLLMRLDRSRFEPVVISLLDGGEWQVPLESLGIKVHSMGMKRGVPTPKMMATLLHLVRSMAPDIIQGWMYHGNIAASIAALALPIKPAIVWCIQNTTELKLEKPLTALLIRAGVMLSKQTASIVYVSHGAQRQHESMGYAKVGCAIANGCETDRFIPDLDAGPSVRAELGLSPETPLIGLFARFHPMKDQATFLTAAAHLQLCHPEVHYLMAGSDVTPENRVLKLQIDALGLSDRVHLLGIRRDTPRLAAALDIFSLSSAYGEALPLVLGEAMACGVPCVATDVGDSARVIGPTGRIVPPQDPLAFTTAWMELLDMGVDGRARLGAAARDRIMDLFDIDGVVMQYEQLYGQVIKGERFDPRAIGLDYAPPLPEAA